MPEPITTAVKNALPSSSASSRRHNAMSLTRLRPLYWPRDTDPAVPAAYPPRLLSPPSSIGVDAAKPSLPGWIDGRQDRGMSIQAGRKTLELIPVARSRAEVEGCAIPLVREPIGEAAAVGLAQVFKALSDTSRSRTGSPRALNTC